MEQPSQRYNSLTSLLPSEGGGKTMELKAAVRNKQLLMLAVEGVSASKAAQLVGCSPETARAVYRSGEFQQFVVEQIDAVLDEGTCAYKKRMKGLHEALQEQALASFQDLVGMLQSETLSAGLRVKINQDFLDRVGESARKGEMGVNLRFDPAQLRLAAKAAQEMDQVIDVTPSPSESAQCEGPEQLSLFND